MHPDFPLVEKRSLSSEQQQIFHSSAQWVYHPSLVPGLVPQHTMPVQAPSIDDTTVFAQVIQPIYDAASESTDAASKSTGNYVYTVSHFTPPSNGLPMLPWKIHIPNSNSKQVTNFRRLQIRCQNGNEHSDKLMCIRFDNAEDRDIFCDDKKKYSYVEEKPFGNPGEKPFFAIFSFQLDGNYFTHVLLDPTCNLALNGQPAHRLQPNESEAPRSLHDILTKYFKRIASAPCRSKENTKKVAEFDVRFRASPIRAGLSDGRHTPVDSTINQIARISVSKQKIIDDFYPFSHTNFWQIYSPMILFRQNILESLTTQIKRLAPDIEALKTAADTDTQATLKLVEQLRNLDAKEAPQINHQLKLKQSGIMLAILTLAPPLIANNLYAHLQNYCRLGLESVASRTSTGGTAAATDEAASWRRTMELGHTMIFGGQAPSYRPRNNKKTSGLS